MSKEIENKNKREVDMKTTDIKDLDINLNGIQGVDAILDMIKDTIDNGDTEDAKMWISDLQDELYDNGVRG
jgi:nitrogen regulatory protein PII